MAASPGLVQQYCEESLRDGTENDRVSGTSSKIVVD
jgi:hypothetical protein